MERQRLTGFDRLLLRLEEEEAQLQEEKGILEIFERNEDAPLARDDSD
jgi:hypothetical protein